MRFRFVSLGGVIALAAMVVLAGCGGATQTTTDTDYVTPLVGTWMSGSIEAKTTIPAAGELPEREIDVTRTVTATIAKGTGSNMDTVSLTVMTTAPESAPPQPPIAVTGSIEVIASEITVTITNVTPEAAVPAAVRAALSAAPQTLTYELMDNDLKVSGRVLTFLGATKTAEEKLTLTKQAAS